MLAITVAILTMYFYYDRTYYSELKHIENELNNIKGVRVVDIWGYEDLDLEEISARIIVNDRDEVVLGSLSKDVFNYPRNVYIKEINGKSFIIFSCFYLLGIGSSLNVGKNSFLEELSLLEFNTPADVLKEIRLIDSLINSLPSYPNFKHFEGKRGPVSGEAFVATTPSNKLNEDPINTLIRAKNLYTIAKGFNWKNEACVH